MKLECLCLNLPDFSLVPCLCKQAGLDLPDFSLVPCLCKQAGLELNSG